MAWTKILALGLLMGSAGCVVSVDDDPDDNFGGDGGSLGLSGNGGRSGNGGSTTTAGTGGTSGGGGGTGGVAFPAPTCDAEPGDETDECARCMKEACCTPWLGCDDETCSNEFIDVSECVQSIEFATSDDLLMCISMSSATDDFVQENTQVMIDCAISPAGDAGIETLCSTACFGSEIFPE